MKTFALALCAIVVLVGAAPLALAQQDASKPSAAPSSPAPSAAPSTPSPSPASDVKAPPATVPSGKLDVDIKARTEKSDDAGAASPRSGEVHRTGFFGLSPTAAIIVSVAVLLVVILAIVAMTHSGGGTTYIDNTDRRV